MGCYVLRFSASYSTYGLRNIPLKKKTTQKNNSAHLCISKLLRATGDNDPYSKGSQAINTSLRKQTYCVVRWQTRLIVKII